MATETEVLLSLREEAAQRETNDAREAELYGELLSDMKLLRRRGFGVWRVGDKLSVDHRLFTVAEFKERAARERRLMETPTR